MRSPFTVVRRAAFHATRALRLDEISVKVGEGGPTDDEQDVDRPVWGGHVPIREAFGEPVPDEAGAAFPVPDYVTTWTR